MNGSANQSTTASIEALVLTGDVISRFSTEDVQRLGAIAAHFGLTLRGMPSVPEVRDTIAGPIVASHDDFVESARLLGWHARRGSVSYFAVLKTHAYENGSDYPAVLLSGGASGRIDLRSVRDRLLASSMGCDAWVGGTKAGVRFLADLALSKIPADEPSSLLLRSLCEGRRGEVNPGGHR